MPVLSAGVRKRLSCFDAKAHKITSDRPIGAGDGRG